MRWDISWLCGDAEMVPQGGGGGSRSPIELQNIAYFTSPAFSLAGCGQWSLLRGGIPSSPPALALALR